MSTGTLKVGIVGARRGSAFMPGFQAAAEVEVVALCDANPQTLEEYADKYNIEQRYTNYEAMLDRDLDIIVVATPMPLHVPMSVAALNAGKHVLCEVPAATDLLQCWQLVEAVLSSGRKYMMAENCCYMKEAVLISELARHGLFGELYFGEGEYTHELKEANQRTPWRRVWQMGRRGCTYSTHSIGPLLQWFNAATKKSDEVIKVASVACFGSGHHYRDWRGQYFENDDVNLMLCQLSNGGLAKIRNDMISERPLKNDYNSLQGTKGCYEAPRGFGDEPKIWLADHHRKDEWHSLWDFEDEFLPEIWRNPSAEAVRAGHGGSDYFQVRDFIDSIVKDTTPPIDVFAALDMTVPGLVSEESIRCGGAVLPVPDFRVVRNFPDDLPDELKGSCIIQADLPSESRTQDVM